MTIKLTGRFAALTLLMATTVAVTAACGSTGSSGSSNNSTASSHSARLTQGATVTIGISNPNAAQFLPFLAKSAGYFSAYNVTANVEVLPPATLISGLSAGSIQFGVISPPQIELAHLQTKAPVGYLATWTLHSQLEFVAPPGISSLKQLKGKPIALSAPGTVTDVFESYLLKQAGLSMGAVDGVSFSSSATANAAFLGRKVDLVATAPPLSASLLKGLPGSKVLANFSQDKNFLWPQAALGANFDYVSHHSDVAVAVLAAMSKALHLWWSKPSAAESVISANISGITEAESIASYKASLTVFTKTLEAMPKAAEIHVIQILKANGYPSAGSLKPGAILNSSLVATATADAG